MTAEETAPASPFTEQPEDKPASKRKRPGRPRGSRTRKRSPASTTTRTSSGSKKDLSDGIALAWGGLGALAIRTGPALAPSGRVMQFQAPYAGKQLNKVVRQNELLYRFLAPILGQGQLFTDLAPVMLPPILVAMINANPEMAPMLIPMLRNLLGVVAVDVAKEAVKQQETIARMTEAGEEMDLDLDAIIYQVLGWDETPAGAHSTPPDQVLDVQMPPPPPSNGEAPAAADILSGDAPWET